MSKYIIDTEVHLMHPASIEPDFAADTNEPVRKAIHEHGDYPGIKPLMTLETLLKSMEANSVKHCHLMGMSWRHKPWNDDNNMYIEECVKQYPSLFSGFYIPHLGDVRQAVSEVMMLDRDVFLGVKLLPGWQGREVNDPELFPIYEAVQQRDMCLMVHTDHITQSLNGDTPQKLLEVVRNFPEMKVLAPHMGGLLCMYHLLPSYSKALRNVTYIASVSATMEFVKFAAEINPDNILFGTDFPFNHTHDQTTQITALERIGLSSEVQNRILFENAERLFKYKIRS